MQQQGPSAVGTAPHGLVLGVVHDTDDPEGWGRVKVQYPWLDGFAISEWAPIASLMAGNDHGGWFIPELGSEAVLAFDRGDFNKPFVLGFMWNGQDTAPSTSTKERMIRSANKHTIRFLDSSPTSGGNTGGIQIQDASGNSIVLTNGQLTIKAVGNVLLDGATVAIRTGGVVRVVAPVPHPL
jgi:uncharacterized protein involved in type VI secretion and phage assembly